MDPCAFFVGLVSMETVFIILVAGAVWGEAWDGLGGVRLYHSPCPFYSKHFVQHSGRKYCVVNFWRAYVSFSEASMKIF